MQKQYVHGYSEREEERLVDQANILTDLLHHDTRYPAGSLVLEAGCGVGAQTVTLAAQSPRARFVSMDISPASLDAACKRVEAAGLDNVSFQAGDIFQLPFPEEHFDHIFVCFVLEHLREPLSALEHLKGRLKKGGTITVIEGDHGSTLFHPESGFARKAIECLVELQAQAGGNSLIGRQLYPLLQGAGFQNVKVTPRLVYADASRPAYVEGFTKNTFTAMVEGVREQALGTRLISSEDWDRGIRDLHRTAEADGVFLYTFFKGVGVKPG